MPDYLLGHSDLEIERLQLQARCLEGVTRRLILENGIKPGMRVLDIGCSDGERLGQAPLIMLYEPARGLE